MENKLVKNNPTAKKIFELNKLREKRKNNIKGIIGFWSMVLVASCFGKINYNSSKIVAKNTNPKIEIINHNFKNKIIDIKGDTIIEKKNHKHSNVHISERGRKLIKDNEGFSPQGYWDVNGVTIGYGHKIKSTDPKWLREKKVGDWISKHDAQELFEKDMNEFINPALVRITDELAKNKVYISQNVVDGLASLIYNCGEQGVKTTHFYELLKQGKIKEAISCVNETRIYQEAHKTRRKSEQAMMMGNYSI